MNSDFMTINNVVSMLDRKIFSCEEFMGMVFDNIARLGCATGAYITVCKDSAMAEARRLDKEGRTKILSGIPVAIKDNIYTKGLRTTAGSKMLEKFVPDYDATVVKRLKSSGAIIVGKTNMDEFGMGSGCENSAFKSTANPVDFSYVPGGSSGGSAAAVRAGLAIAALGTDTGGSIRQPAAFCKVYGLKPTHALVPGDGVIEYAPGLDVTGPVCNSAKDCAIMMTAMTGYDYTQRLTCDVKGMKIGIPKEFFEDCDEDVIRAVTDAAQHFEKMGAIVEECSLPQIKYALACYFVVASCEAAVSLKRFSAENEKQSIQMRTEGFGKEVKRRILMGTHLLEKDNYRMALNCVRHIKDGFDTLLDKYDLLLTPVSSKRVWKRGEVAAEVKKTVADKCTVAVSLAKLPAISVPCGDDKNGMPVGMQLIGKAYDEQKILNTAFAFEAWHK